MTARHGIVAPLAVLALAAGCGGDEPADETTPAATTVETTLPTTTEETTTVETTPAPPRPRQIVIVVDQGRPRGGIERPEVKQGSRLVLVIRVDVGEAVHVHGYDIERPVTPGKPVRIPITASLPGRFEVELHHPDALLAVLSVRP